MGRLSADCAEGLEGIASEFAVGADEAGFHRMVNTSPTG